MPSNRAAFDFETGEEANPKGFRLLPGNAELVARVDLGSAGRSCALWLDGVTSLQADADARIDWAVFVSPDLACDVAGEEPVAEGSSYLALPTSRRGLLFACDGLLARYVFLQGTLTRSTGTAQVNFKLQFTTGTRTEPGITAGPLIG
jgi:hypothetical protein